MKIKFGAASIFGLGILFGNLAIPVMFAQLRTVNTTKVMTADLGGWCDGKEVTVELNEAAPGTSGKHFRPAHSFTYILDGLETYALEGRASKTVRAGDVLYEAPMQVHTVDNLSPVKLLVVRVIEKGKPATVRLP